MVSRTSKCYPSVNSSAPPAVTSLHERIATLQSRDPGYDVLLSDMKFIRDLKSDGGGLSKGKNDLAFSTDEKFRVAATILL